MIKSINQSPLLALMLVSRLGWLLGRRNAVGRRDPDHIVEPLATAASQIIVQLL